METIVVDGTEHPTAYDSTLTVTADAPDTWRVGAQEQRAHPDLYELVRHVSPLGGCLIRIEEAIIPYRDVWTQGHSGLDHRR